MSRKKKPTPYEITRPGTGWEVAMPQTDDWYDELEDDELFEEDAPRRQGIDHEARAQLAELGAQLGGYEYQPDENELALLSQRITDLEQKAGVDLDDEDFQRVGVQQLNINTRTSRTEWPNFGSARRY